jgi:hypothetical protein
MENSINKQFKMIPGAKEVDTMGTFKNSDAVLNMGAPTNYITPSTAASAGAKVAGVVKKGVQKFKDWANKYDWTLKSSAPSGGRSLVAPSSKGGKRGFSGDSTPKSQR